MKMKMIIVAVAALAAAQPVAAASPAQAGDLPHREAKVRPAAFEADAEPNLDRAEILANAEAAREDRPRKKRKSTGDKLLTGAAVVLGVGALAVGGLLVAIFVG